MSGRFGGLDLSSRPVSLLLGCVSGNEGSQQRPTIKQLAKRATVFQSKKGRKRKTRKNGTGESRNRNDFGGGEGECPRPTRVQDTEEGFRLQRLQRLQREGGPLRNERGRKM